MDTRLDQATRLIELERAQIGHEIHDALLPLIFAASAGVSNLIDATEREETASSPDSTDAEGQRLRQVAIWLDDALQIGRRLLTHVYPPELTGAAWVSTAVTDIERLLGEQSSIVTWNVDPEINSIDPNVALAAYRIVIEAIRNSTRHGKATSASVQTCKDQDHWQIIITDDGNGFDVSQIPKDRFGIRAMIGRAELAGGTLTVDSQPGGPTSVTFRFPQ